MRYKYIFIDMDGTLFDFDKSERLSFMFAMRENGLPCTEEIIKEFHEINDRLWRIYETGEISRNEVQVERFKILFKNHDWSADASPANELYRRSLSQNAVLLDGAYDLCRSLSEKHKLYIVTNGSFSQRARLDMAGLTTFFSDIFISEEIGFHKPQREFFEYAIEKAGIGKRSECLVVGDAPTSDIAGASAAGIDSCLFSCKDISCGYTYRIKRLEELVKIVD